jgi:hypothetical protein
MSNNQDWITVRAAIEVRVEHLNATIPQMRRDVGDEEKTYREIILELTSKLRTLLERSKEDERIRDENYQDLLDQMDEAWGVNFQEVGGPEIRAFLESRIVHKPTASLRSELASRNQEIERLRKTHDQGVRRLREVEKECDDAHVTISLERGVAKEQIEARNQRIEELEREVGEWRNSETGEVVKNLMSQLGSEVERRTYAQETCREISDKTWGKAIKVAEYQFDTTGSGSMMLASMRKAREVEAARQREDEGK